MPSKPDAQTVAQMAATIASGLVASDNVHDAGTVAKIVTNSVALARAIVAQVERTEHEHSEPQTNWKDAIDGV